MDRKQRHIVILLGTALKVHQRIKQLIAGSLRGRPDRPANVILIRSKPNGTPFGLRQSVIPSVNMTSIESLGS